MTLPYTVARLSGVTTIAFVLALSLLGLLSIAFVFHFRLKTQSGQFLPLRGFNTLWPVRILLVLFASLWSLAELLRLPLFRYPPWFLSSLSVKHQAHLCKFYIVSSQGFFEPCFFMTALFLVKGSLQSDQNRNREGRTTNNTAAGSTGSLRKALFVILFSSLPLFLLQLFWVFISPGVPFGHENQTLHGFLPEVFGRSHVVRHVNGHEDTALCAYPLASTILLGGFGLVYVPCFFLACLKMGSLVINKRLRARVYGLAFSLLFSFPIQVLLLGASVYWRPGGMIFEVLSFVCFLSNLSFAVVSEGILVIRPIADALAVGFIEKSSSARSGGDKSVVVKLQQFDAAPDLEGEESLLGDKAVGEQGQGEDIPETAIQGWYGPVPCLDTAATELAGFTNS